ADIRGFQSDVEIVVRAPGVSLLALAIREESHGPQIRTLEELYAVVERQPLAGVKLIGDIAKARRTQSIQHSHPSALRRKPQVSSMLRLTHFSLWLRALAGRSASPPNQHSSLSKSHHLNAQRARSRAVQFRHEHALPLAEHQLAARHMQRQAVAEEH